MAATLTTRTAGLMIGCALAIGWLGATVTQPAAPQQTRVPSSNRSAVSGQTTVPRAERLRERMIQPPSPGRGRNPFVFSARPAAPATRDHQQHGDESVAAPAPAIPEAPPVPVFRLSGIASDTKNGVTVLTAIINDNGTMVFAKTGDKLSNGYSVVKVDELSVTLVDATGVTQTIRLP